MPSPFRARPLPAFLAAALGLGGCSGVDSIGSTLISGGATPQKNAFEGADLSVQPVCPPVEIRHGTEVMPIFAPGRQNDPSALQYQASLQRVARECSIVGDKLVVRVGAAGRVASGPTGATGTLQVPVRIAAVKGEEVVYSKLHMVPVTVQAPEFAALWSQVDDAVQLTASASSGVTIYVGFDETGKKTAPQKKKRS